MYQEIFTSNFFLNFFTGFLFLILNILSSITISEKFKIKRVKFFDEYQIIVIFFIFFIFYSFIFNLIILLNFINFFNFALYTLIILKLFFILNNLNYIKKKKITFKSIKFDKLEIYIFLFLSILFLIAILPISDADSIALHQYLSNYIYKYGLTNIDFQKDISFTIFSNTQNILIISPILKSDNFGSQLNFVILFLFVITNFKNNKNFLLILFSCPLIIYFISVQKLQLFFGILYLLIFILIDKKYFRNKLEIFIIILLLSFYSSGNLSYILFSIPLFIYFLIQINKEWSKIIFFSIISFSIVLLPIFLIKQEYYSNIIAPFFDNIFGNDNYLYNAYAHSIRSTDGWLTDPSNLNLYLRPFISFNLNQFSSSLGIIFLLMLLNTSLLKRTKFFPLIIIFLVIITGQILPRYYFEAFLILSFYYNFKNFFSKTIIGFYNLAILGISILFIYFSYVNSNVIFNKDKFMNKFSYSYFDSQQLKKLNTEDNILDFSLSTQSTFFDKNVYSFRTLGVLNSYKKEEDYLTDYINFNSIKYIITDQPQNIPSCITLKKIGETKRKLAVRNFLRKEQIRKQNFLKIVSNDC